MAKRMVKSYFDAPVPFKAANNNWNNYVQRFKHFFLENGVTECT